MAKRRLLRMALTVASVPFVALSRAAEAINLWDLKADIALCLQTVDRDVLRPIPRDFVQALVAAEDRRNALHPGVDPIGIVRAILAHLTKKGVQGASTIEQQFVRVVSGSYERTIQRKIREQALAIAVSRRRSKTQIASAYLGIAYYGPGLIGTSGLRSLCGTDLDASQPRQIHEAIARLKYPEPVRPSMTWNRKLGRRATYITCRLPKNKKRPPSTPTVRSVFLPSQQFPPFATSPEPQV